MAEDTKNYISYSEKLRNPEWQKKRLEILSRDKFTCILCRDNQTELHVHHKKYFRGKQPWECENNNLQTLCKHCHLLIEFFKKKDATVVSCRKVIYEKDFQCFSIELAKPLNEAEPIAYEVCLNDMDISIMYNAMYCALHSLDEILF